jgi:hypothetical protein
VKLAMQTASYIGSDESQDSIKHESSGESSSGVTVLCANGLPFLSSPDGLQSGVWSDRRTYLAYFTSNAGKM